MFDFQRSLQQYFSAAAANYTRDIEPVLLALVRALVTAADPTPGNFVVDLGTGNGIAARILQQQRCSVAALDFSFNMAKAATKSGTLGVAVGDMHILPFADSTFDAAVAVFAFNSTSPLVALAESHRVLKPSAKLSIQEWGTADPLSDLLGEILVDYSVQDPPEELAQLRLDQLELHPWDELDTSDDIRHLFEEAHFIDVKTRITTIQVRLANIRTFIDYKLAWPIRQAELQAMSEEIQQLCLSDIQENLSPFAEADGSLVWEPNLVQVFGRKAAK